MVSAQLLALNERAAAATSGLAAASAGNDLLGGTDLLRLLVLAVGGALVVGNVLALVRPPSRLAAAEHQASPARPPLARSAVMIGVGLVAVIWAIASLTTG